MRIAAIDCGTNSIHIIVVRIRPDLSFEVIDREKEMVRLGSGGLEGKALRAGAMEKGIKTQVISGTEEARLIHLAAVYGVDVAGASAVVIDIGGGSVEITHGAGA